MHDKNQIEFKKRLIIIKNKIKELNNDIDVTKINNRLEEIINSSDEYHIKINKIKKLEKELTELDELIKLKIKLNYIKRYLNNTNNFYEFNYFKKMTIECIDTLKRNSKKDKEFINDIYRTIYEMIKLEYLVDNTSEIYSSLDKLQISMICIWIHEDIKSLPNINIDIKEPLELIKIITKYQNNSTITRIKDDLDKTIQDIAFQEYDTTDSEISSLLNERELIEIKKKGQKRIINQKLISILLTLGLITGGAYGNYQTAKHLSKNHVYIKTTTKYLGKEDKVITDTKERPYLLSHSDTTKIYVYEPTESLDRIKIDKYDLSNIKLDSIYEYLNYNLNTYSPQTSILVGIDGMEEEYNQKYIDVINTTYTDTGKIANNQYIILLVIIKYLIYIIGLYAIIYKHLRYKILITPLEEILKEINNIKESNNYLEENYLKIMDKLKRAMDIIYNNDRMSYQVSYLFDKYKTFVNIPERLLEPAIINQEYDNFKNRIRILTKTYKLK